MDVDCSSALSNKPKPWRCRYSSSFFQIVFPVRVAAEDHLALIALANNLVKRSRIFESSAIASVLRLYLNNLYESLHQIP